jgi:membrane-bound ClpP family serine protease
MVQNESMDDFLPLTLAIIGVVLIFVLPVQRAGMTLALLLGILLGLTLLDLGLHRPTSSDIGGFALALMVGGFALLTRVDTRDKK